MSLANSDFGDDPFADATIESDDGMMQPGEEAPMAPAPPQFRKQEFSIYSVMLILSFAFLSIAAILFFIDAGKY